MKTDPRSKIRDGKPYRLSIRHFLGMIGQGIFPPDVRVELLRGVLIEHLPRSPRHDAVVGALGALLRPTLPDSWGLRNQEALEIGRKTRVDPDFAVVRLADDPAPSVATQAEEVGLLIEVADATYPYDRGVKWRTYASARIPIYWILNLNQGQIEIYRDPQGSGKAASYRDSNIFGPDSEVPVILDGREVARFRVKDVIARVGDI